MLSELAMLSRSVAETVIDNVDCDVIFLVAPSAQNTPGIAASAPKSGLAINAGTYVGGIGAVPHNVKLPEPPEVVPEVELEVLESGLIEPDGIEPDVVEPDVVEPDVVEPDVVEPDVVEPDVVEPDVVDDVLELVEEVLEDVLEDVVVQFPFTHCCEGEQVDIC